MVSVFYFDIPDIVNLLRTRSPKVKTGESKINISIQSDISCRIKRDFKMFRMS